MNLTELLKQVGLTQYEAEAYSTLLREGPLTGYELGKRSNVPLPRSYDVLERLTNRGLALVQPGDPPRFLAEDPARFLVRLRSGMAARLDALEAELAAIAPPDDHGELWVVRGQDQIKDRLAAMIRAAERSVELLAPEPLRGGLQAELDHARRRGCSVVPIADNSLDDAVLLLLDACEVLAGTVAADAQAVVTRNRGLITVAERAFAGVRLAPSLPPAGATREAADDWLAWETEKHRRLRLLAGGADVA